jgi:hypothetical protein
VPERSAVCLFLSRSAALRLGFRHVRLGIWFGVQRNETVFFSSFFAGMMCYGVLC